MAVVNTLVSRAIAISEPGNLQHEKKHLVRTLEENGYHRGITESTFKMHLQRRKNLSTQETDPEPEPSQPVALIAYSKGYRTK